MVEIPLTRGLVAIVDDEDAYLAQWKWHAWKNSNGRWYARRAVDNKKIYLHREVLKAPFGVEVDHCNTTATLDCRRANIRLASHQENARNVGRRRDNTSGFKGVSFDGRCRKPWYAYIRVDGKRKNLGRFSTVTDAAKAYDRAARAYFNEFAQLNFSEAT